ncbi:hypothetical protein C1H46_006000, partial [Malus baccata]
VLFINFCGGRKVECSRETARLTVELLRTVISAQKLPSPTNPAAALIEAVRGVGQRFIAANPVGPFAIGNIVRHIFHIIREEELSLCFYPLKAGIEIVMREMINQGIKTSAFPCLELTKVVTEAVNDLIEDIKTCHEQIADLMVELIHQKYLGHVIVKELAAKGIQITMITDSSVFAMISRVNMVIVGVHAVIANGGIIASVGTNMVALAAKKHAVPFVVVAGTLGIIKFEHIHTTFRGGPNPSYIYRLVSDFYSADDLGLHQKPAS